MTVKQTSLRGQGAERPSPMMGHLSLQPATTAKRFNYLRMKITSFDLFSKISLVYIRNTKKSGLQKTHFAFFSNLTPILKNNHAILSKTYKSMPNLTLRK